MPILLLPTPRRLHRTHENYPLDRPARLQLPSGISPDEEEALRRELEALFPDLQADPVEEDAGGVVRFSLYRSGDAPEEVPEGARAEAIRLNVSPEGIEVEAGSTAGWLRAAHMLRGLRERDELVGLTLLDWPSFPVRQVDLPWPAATMSEAGLERWLRLMALARFNRLGAPVESEAGDLPECARTLARQLGISIAEPAPTPTAHLLSEPTLFPSYATVLSSLQEAAQRAEQAGDESFILSLGTVDSQTSLEALAYGLLFAGDCAWNPRKADLKAHRRWYSARRFGFDSRGPVQTIDELETGSAIVATLPSGPAAADADGDSASPGAPDVEDPFDAPIFAGVLQLEERAAELGRRAAAALEGLAPLQPDSEDRAAALQGMQWTAQRLKMLGRRLGTAEQVRQLYRAAYIASASPRAVSQRLLRAAELLESEARTLDEHRAEWHALWRRERREPYDPDTEAALRHPVALFRSRAERLKALRDRYIQTGTLPSPAEEGLERTGTRLAEGLTPSRLPPQPSPAWWPEGGAARMRIEVDCPEVAAGMPWEVQVDFRALAGEVGAFNVRSARLLPLTETDEAGPEQPCQLVRGGVVFIPEAGQKSYFLYLDPLPGPDFGFRETRAGQSRSGLRLENRHMQLRLSPADGQVSGWRLLESGLELLPPEPEPEAEERPATEWRLRVLETGPLLARARAEHADGRIRQLDLSAGQSWAELSVNAPWSDFSLPTRAELWSDGTVALFGGEGSQSRLPLTQEVAGTAGVKWAAPHRPDGLTLALASDIPIRAEVSREQLILRGDPHGASVLLFTGWESDPAAALTRLLAAHRTPPVVRLGIIEERRVREF